MAGPIRVAVVGVAGMGRAHCFAASTLPEYEFVAVCDVAEPAREKTAKHFGVLAFADAGELFESGVCDAVALATPSATHVRLTRDALAAGLHVYCEKPFAADAADGYALGAAADAAGLTVQVGFQFRFQPSYAHARSLIEAGEVGEIFRANLHATSWFRPRDYFDAAPWRKEWRSASGGVLMNLAIHQLDALLWFAGLPSRVTARAARARHDVAVEDDVMAMLEFPNGGRGSIIASSVDPVGFDRLEVHGETSSLVMEGHELRIGSFAGPAQHLSDTSTNHFDRVPVTWTDVPVAAPGPMGDLDYVLDAHRDFAHAIAEKRPPRNAPSEGTRAIEVANAVYLSTLRGEPVDLPLAAGAYAPAYEGLCSGALELPKLWEKR